MTSEKPKSSNILTTILIVGFILGIFAAAISYINLEGEAKYNKAKADMLAAQLAAKPDMPVSVSIREALMGNGLVAQFTNNSNRYIAVVATFTNPTTNQSVTARIDISPNDTKEIGHLEGWAFSSGDQILLEHNDYRSSRITVQ